MKNDEQHPTYFRSPAELRAWFEKNHQSLREFWIGFHKKGSGTPSITWPESVDEALCVGWIDGVRKRVDETRYKIRFTPRRPTSIWSAVNIRRVAALTEAGRMTPAGVRAFAARKANRSIVYSFEQRAATLCEPYLGILKENKSAFAFFESRSPSFRKTAAWWVTSAKKEETRMSRLKQLIADCNRGATPKVMVRPAGASRRSKGGRAAAR